MKQELWPLVLALVMPLMLTGCALNAYEASRHFDYAEQAEKAGDYKLARQQYNRAFADCQMGLLGPADEASCAYAWSRVTGYLGLYADAEKGFKDVLTLIDKAHGKADGLRAPTLCELARLLHDTDQHQKAIPVYERALAELEKTSVAKDDPIGFADFLDDYASSLRMAGETARADEISGRAVVIHEQNKGLTAKFVAKRYKAEPSASANGASPRR